MCRKCKKFCSLGDGTIYIITLGTDKVTSGVAPGSVCVLRDESGSEEKGTDEEERGDSVQEEGVRD